MRRIQVIIPTCKTRAEVAPQLCEVEGFCFGDAEAVFATCLPVSAATNRNAGLDHCAAGDIVIMIDDDIRGFYPLWHRDLIAPLLEYPDGMGPAVVSARLLTTTGEPALMMFQGDTLIDGWCRVPRVPTAAIAFIWDGETRFDEEYIGSGFEDDDFLAQLYRLDPLKPFVINNRCRLTHINERKNQDGKYWDKNKAHFETKWQTYGDNRYDLLWNFPPTSINPSNRYRRGAGVSEAQYALAGAILALGETGGWYYSPMCGPFVDPANPELFEGMSKPGLAAGIICSVDESGNPDGKVVAVRKGSSYAFALRHSARRYASVPLGDDACSMAAVLKQIVVDIDYVAVVKKRILEEKTPVPTIQQEAVSDVKAVEGAGTKGAGKVKRSPRKRKLPAAGVDVAGPEEQRP